MVAKLPPMNISNKEEVGEHITINIYNVKKNTYPKL